MRRIGATFIACFGLAIVVLGAFVAFSPGASADVPPGACLTPAAATSTPTLTSTPATGTPTATATVTQTPAPYYLVVTLPTAAAANANGLCVTLDGIPRLAQLFVNGPGCTAAVPTTNAANSYVSADWGGVATPSANCVKPGQSVVLAFKDATPPAIGTVTWNLANVTPVGTGTPTATPFPGTALLQFGSGGVGGVAELADSNGALPASTQSSGSSTPLYALFAAIAIVAAATVGAGWYVRRRRLS